jgi:hypothetical protein
MTIEEQKEKLLGLLRQRHAAGTPVERDVATHALLLIGNGWPAEGALEESKRTLDDAGQEGAY